MIDFDLSPSKNRVGLEYSGLASHAAARRTRASDILNEIHDECGHTGSARFCDERVCVLSKKLAERF